MTNRGDALRWQPWRFAALKGNAMRTNQILGAVLLAVGIVLMVFAYQAATSPVERIVETFTGRFTDRTTWLWISGVAATVGGAVLLVFGKRP
jgi:drug/metabolite transporter (DMT)-like permease